MELKKNITKKNISDYFSKDKNVSDYILDFLASKNVKYVFVLTGGAIAFTIDSFSKRKDIKYVCVQHEQAAAMMADAYSRVGPGYAATMSTSGPGATNLVTGVGCSYFDSIPNLHITGQVNLHEQRGSMEGTSDSRQIGFQETDIVSIISPITKKAIQLKNANEIFGTLDELYDISISGRPGPVLLDLPMNLQRLPLPKKLYRSNKKTTAVKKSKVNYKSIIKLLKSSIRPVIIAGGGIRISNAVKEFNELIKNLKIPVVTAWSGIDSIDYNNKQYIGHIGVYGSRGGNFSVQNADLIISLGSRLDTRVTGGRPETFARNSKLIMVDIDRGELSKRRGLVPFKEICEDVSVFMKELNHAAKALNYTCLSKHDVWLNKCLSWKSIYPTVSEEFAVNDQFVNPYIFVEELSSHLKTNDIVIPDDGAHLTWFMQAFKLKLGQRVFSSFANSPMGYSFPASIGASIALNKKRIICIDGDGSFQINMQELQTVVQEKLPIKIIIMNNAGYGIIKQFQELYMGKRFNATGIGVSAPNYKKIAKAYGLRYRSIRKNKNIKRIVKKILCENGASITDVFIHPNQKIFPKLTFGNPIENLSPCLSKADMQRNMLVHFKDSEESFIEAN